MMNAGLLSSFFLSGDDGDDDDDDDDEGDGAKNDECIFCAMDLCTHFNASLLTVSNRAFSVYSKARHFELALYHQSMT